MTYVEGQRNAKRYLEKLTSEIVSKSGIPTDKYHLGKMVLKGLRDHPQAINQIDGGTGESETNGSVLLRSTRLASCMRQFGLQRGDVMALLAPNHIDVCIPFYAALYLGVIDMALDKDLPLRDLEAMFEIGRPKIIFCHSEKASDVKQALNNLDMDSQIVTFDSGVHMTFTDFMNKYDDKEYNVDKFKPDEFDGTDTIAFNISTSGTTGLPKSAAVTHKNCAMALTVPWYDQGSRTSGGESGGLLASVFCGCGKTKPSPPKKLVLVCSPLQWMTAHGEFLLGAIYPYTRLQTSSPLVPQHVYELINKYRPTCTVLSPTSLFILLKLPERLQCDFTCFDTILLGGSAVSIEVVQMLKAVIEGERVYEVYGMTEIVGMAFIHDGTSPPGSCGKPINSIEYRLIDLETGKDISEPSCPGELWIRGPGIFKEYYRDLKATEEAFPEGRWFRTGDIFKRDSAHNYFYVDRVKLLFKYKTFNMSYQISPLELENVIRTHSDVGAVAVTSVPDPTYDSLAVACIIKKPGSNLTAQQVKDFVKDKLPEQKHLHGGVIFVSAFPMTSTAKINRQKLKEMAMTTPRE